MLAAAELGFAEMAEGRAVLVAGKRVYDSGQDLLVQQGEHQRGLASQTKHSKSVVEAVVKRRA